MWIFDFESEKLLGLSRNGPPGLKTRVVVKNDIMWSELRSGFGDSGGTPLPRIPSTPFLSPLSDPDVEY